MGKDLASRLTAAINKQFSGSASLASAGRSRSEVRLTVPTGIFALDHYVIGLGGLPCGRMVELFSEEGGGKSSLVYAAAAGAQQAGGTAVLVESEASFSEERARVFGVDTGKLVLVEAAAAETGMALEGVLQRIETIAHGVKPADGPVLVAWDSLAATPTAEEVKNGVVGDEMASDRAKTLSRACRALSGLAATSGICLLVVNQTRTKFGGGWGGPDYTTPGGKAVKFHSSLRLQILGGAAVKDHGRHVAKDVTIMAAKNRHAPPWRKARVRLDYATGWDDVWSTVSMAKDFGVVPKAAHYTEATAAQGREALTALWAGEAADGDA